MAVLIANRFERGELIGRGSMGEVYRGRDTLTDHTVAIKSLKVDLVAAPNLVERFVREGIALRELNHPNVVKMLEMISEQDRHYIVMEYVGGGSLADLLRATPQLSVRRTLEIALDLADALTRVHRLQIIHRDIKPANVLIADDGTARLTDFGVAQLENYGHLTQNGSLVGTYLYLSPEACNGEGLDSRADIWSFGVMLFEMLTGRRPFEATHPRAILNAILHTSAPELAKLRPDVPAALIDLINRMLIKDREQRIASVRRVGAEIEALLHGVEPPGYVTPITLATPTGNISHATIDLTHEQGHTTRTATTLPVGTVTFLLTDIADSITLRERYPVEGRRAVEQYDALLERYVSRNKGFMIRSHGEGDSRFAVFDHPSDAVAAASALQQAFHAESWPTPPIRVRMALHTGEAELHAGDYSGPTVNRCARLRDLAQAGQTLLSLATVELTRSSLPEGVQVRDLGDHQLRDMSRPERVFQLVIPGLPDSFVTLISQERRQSNLPVHASALIGREQELATTIALLRRDDVRLLTLTGPGGVGKTRLSLQIAADLLGDFADGVCHVALASISDADLVAAIVAHELGVIETSEQLLLEQLKNYLSSKHLLLLLDNFEQVLAAAPLVAALLAAAPRLKVLVTSQAPLRLYHEHEFPVPPLALPDMRSFPPVGARIVAPALMDTALVPRLENYPAVSLFVQRASAVKPGFALTSANARAVAEICTRLDGLPLAIELAAARTKVLTPGALLSRLEKRFKVLVGGAQDLHPRQQTLRATIDWSHNLLSDAERLLFARFSVFVGGCTLEAAEDILDTEIEVPDTGSSGVAQAVASVELNVLDVLASLVDKSLVRQAGDEEEETRFTMLETVREYALERLGERSEAEALRHRHAEYYLALAEEAEPELTGPEQSTYLARLEREHGNLRAALVWALERDEITFALRLGGALWRFWYTRGYLSEGRRWLEAALAAGAVREDSLPKPVRAKALNGAGGLAWAQGDYAQAQGYYNRSVALFRELEDRTGIAQGLNNLGMVLLHQNELDQARALYEESLALFRSVDNRWGIANALSNLGLLALQQADYQQARASYAESLSLRRWLADQRGIAIALSNLGEVTLYQGDYAQAKGFYSESLQLCQALGDREGVAYCLEGLAGVARGTGQFRQAARLWGAASSLREQIGAPLPPVERTTHAHAVADTRAQTDPHMWETAWATGRSFPIDQLIAELTGEGVQRLGAEPLSE